MVNEFGEEEYPINEWCPRCFMCMKWVVVSEGGDGLAECMSCGWVEPFDDSEETLKERPEGN